MVVYQMAKEKFEDVIIRFDTVHEHDWRQMDRHRIGHVFVLTGSAAPSDCLLLGAVYKFAYLLTYLLMHSIARQKVSCHKGTHTHTHKLVDYIQMHYVAGDHWPQTTHEHRPGPAYRLDFNHNGVLRNSRSC